MPSLNLMVNTPVPGDEQQFALDFSKFSAETLEKPEAFISVSITVNKTLTFAGNFKPAFQLSVISLDNLTDELNEVYSAKLSKYLFEKLGIESDRGYVSFVDPGRGFIGFKGTTFTTIFGKK
ncbi:hypothetical protein MKEN_01232700 [Mycena kentingensis (nom. inval.)]|nr:hypothetical protein MKEN_01232700 [Mycena kentingensis (nom. inval.)]